eukprot:TRINITY_DN10628_c1_g1_i2.p1 TRINITY_DN10628_c1_g1~~TRINITY_DN10628_c1_g1_i2.p1  ORF type:complete len:368 (-),score=23.41 TRINITY_DN10628_c1_g1_i2:453-1556(-)
MTSKEESPNRKTVASTGSEKKSMESVLWVLLMPVIFVGSAIWLLFEFILNPVSFVNRQSRIECKAPAIPQGFQSEYVEVNGIKLHTVQGGDKNAPLMIFLHGFPEFWFSWRHQLREFSKRYFVVAIDMRGYNLSDKPVGIDQYSTDIIASDVAQTVQLLGYKNCILLGHDWGGAVAQTTAGLYPQIVSKLIVMASANTKLLMLNKNKDNLWKMKHVYFFQLPWIPEIVMSKRNFQVVRQFLKPGCKGGPLYPHANSVEEVEYYVCAIARPGVTTAALNYYRMLGDRMMVHALSSEKSKNLVSYQLIEQPSLIILGQDDTFILPSLWEQPERAFKDVTVQIVQHCSHWVPFDRPDEVNQLITQFLQSN